MSVFILILAIVAVIWVLTKFCTQSIKTEGNIGHNGIDEFYKYEANLAKLEAAATLQERNEILIPAYIRKRELKKRTKRLSQ